MAARASTPCKVTTRKTGQADGFATRQVIVYGDELRNDDSLSLSLSRHPQRVDRERDA